MYCTGIYVCMCIMYRIYLSVYVCNVYIYLIQAEKSSLISPYMEYKQQLCYARQGKPFNLIKMLSVTLTEWVCMHLKTTPKLGVETLCILMRISHWNYLITVFSAENFVPVNNSTTEALNLQLFILIPT